MTDLDKFNRAEMGNCKPEAIDVPIGVNDMGPHRSEKLVAEHKCLLQSLSESRKSVLATGILPRLKVSSEWFSRVLSMSNLTGVG